MPDYSRGAYGSVPAPIDIPASLWQQVKKVAPGLAGATPTATAYITSELGGQLTSAEQKALQDQAAAWGVSAGQPMTTPGGIATNKWDASRLLATMQREHQGLQDYQSLLQSLSATQTPQSLAAEIAARNALFAAAPDPMLAAGALKGAFTSGLKGTAGAGVGMPAVSRGSPFRDLGAFRDISRVMQPGTMTVSGPPGYSVVGGEQVRDTGYTDPYAAWYTSTFGNQGFGAPSGSGKYYQPTIPAESSLYDYMTGPMGWGMGESEATDWLEGV